MGAPAATEAATTPAATDRDRFVHWLLVVAPVVVLAAAAIAAGDFDRPRSAQLVLAFVVLPLLVRDRWPVLVLAIVATGAVSTASAVDEPWVQILAVAVASASVGVAGGERTTSLLVVVVVAAFMVIGILVQDADPLEAIVLPFIAVLPPWLAGDLVRARRVEAARRADAAEQALREREERLRAAVAEERRHVARELHDVIAHAVSVMVIQAGAARQVVRRSPDKAEESLLAIEATGRDAMSELRRFLGALDEGDDAVGGLAPQPGIEALDALLERVREAGLPASLEVDGEPRPVPASLDVTVYRIVQEALTNALRYARQAATLVRISWEPEQLRVEVLDEGPGTTTGESEGSGRGLAGMRDRAALVGGRLEAGPRLGGGYAVRAWLPLDRQPGPVPDVA